MVCLKNPCWKQLKIIDAKAKSKDRIQSRTKQFGNWFSKLSVKMSFRAKRFKSKKLINRATSRPDATLHISKQFVGLKIHHD